MPANVVNIGQSFIRELESDPRQQGLVKAMIALPQDLGYRVVAEGVENEAVQAFLREAGCDEAQGYWFARPMEVDAFSAWCRERINEQVLQLLRPYSKQANARGG